MENTYKAELIGILDKLDDMNITNLEFLQSAEILYKMKLNSVETFAKDSKNVNIESTMLRTEIEQGNEFSTQEVSAMIEKLEALRIRLSTPLTYFQDLTK